MIVNISITFVDICRDSSTCWLVATRRPSDNAITLSSCIKSSELLQVAHHDKHVFEEINLSEEYGIISICVVVLQLIIGLIYGIIRLCRWISNIRGQLAITSEPITIRGQLKTNPPAVSDVPTTRRNSVYFGYV